jgi:hypothetical protein
MRSIMANDKTPLESAMLSLSQEFNKEGAKLEKIGRLHDARILLTIEKVLRNWARKE